MTAIADICTRCREGRWVFFTGPLLGLCKACLENDAVGMKAKLRVLRSEMGLIATALARLASEIESHE